MPTIKDVARLAGVSTTTVSHVLNKTRYVSDETRDTVLRVVDRLGYRPSGIARSLSTNKTQLIGCLIADVTTPFFAALVRGIQIRLSTHDYHPIVCNTDEQAQREAKYLDFLYYQRVEGLIVATTGADQPMYHQFEQQGTPIVFVDRKPPAPVGPFVGVDNEYAGYMATRHLLDLGHRRIGFIARNARIPTMAERLAGYKRALSEEGVRLSDDLTRLSDADLEGAYGCAASLIDLDPRVTAVIAANHATALGVLQVFSDRDIRCPDDVSLVCFDDHAWAPLFTPPLTVIRMPILSLCDRIAEILLTALERRQQEDSTAGRSDCILNPELVIRGSTRALC